MARPVLNAAYKYTHNPVHTNCINHARTLTHTLFAEKCRELDRGTTCERARARANKDMFCRHNRTHRNGRLHTKRWATHPTKKTPEKVEATNVVVVVVGALIYSNGGS